MPEKHTFYTIPEFGSYLQSFMGIYEMYKTIDFPDQKPHLRPAKDRVCRFCKQGYPNVKFKKDAHVIPRQLGNRYLVSDFECDSCNEKFGKYENDLAYFLGISKTLFQTKGQNNKVPTFRSFNDELVATRNNTLNLENSIEIRKKSIESNALNINRSTGDISFEYSKLPYRPFNVYKSFLKIALSLIDNNEVLNYYGAFNILNNSYTNNIVKDMARVYKFTIAVNGGHHKPMLVIYKKRNTWLNFPTHMFVLYFQNQRYQFFPPFHRFDKFAYEKDSPLFPICPPISTEPIYSGSDFKFECVDLSSEEIKKGEVEYINIKSNLNTSPFTVKYDPKTQTGESGVFEPNDIVVIVLVPKGTVIPIDNWKKKD